MPLAARIREIVRGTGCPQGDYAPPGTCFMCVAAHSHFGFFRVPFASGGDCPPEQGFCGLRHRFIGEAVTTKWPKRPLTQGA